MANRQSEENEMETIQKTRVLLTKEIAMLKTFLITAQNCLAKKQIDILFGSTTEILQLVRSIIQSLEITGIFVQDITPAFLKLAELIRLIDEITKSYELSIDWATVVELQANDVADEVYDMFKAASDSVTDPRYRTKSLPPQQTTRLSGLPSNHYSMDDFEKLRKDAKRGSLDFTKFALEMKRTSTIIIESDRRSIINRSSVESGFESICGSPIPMPKDSNAYPELTDPPMIEIPDMDSNTPSTDSESTVAPTAKQMLQTYGRCTYSHDTHSSNIDLRTASSLLERSTSTNFKNVSKRVIKYISVMKQFATHSSSVSDLRSELMSRRSLPTDASVEKGTSAGIDDKRISNEDLRSNSPFQRKTPVQKRNRKKPPPLILKQSPFNIPRLKSTPDDVDSKKSDGDNPMKDLDTKEILQMTKSKVFTVMGGTPNGLIIQATKRNAAFTSVFIATFRTFISPIELIRKLLYRYKYFAKLSSAESHEAAESSYQLLIQIVNSLSDIDLNDNMLKMLMDIIYHMIRTGELLHAIMMRDFYHQKLLVWKARYVLHTPTHKVTRVRFCILNHSAVHLAEQITLIDDELYKKIEVIELLLNSKKHPTACANKNACIDQNERLSYWAQYVILSESNARVRERKMEHLIEVMKCLSNLRNIYSCVAILNALSSSNIERLEWGRSVRNTVRDYAKLCSPEGNWNYTRSVMDNAEVPSIPLIAIYLKDLDTINETRPNQLDNGMLNFEKLMDQYYTVLRKFQKYKKNWYPFAKIDIIYNYLRDELPFLDQETLYNLSQDIRPKAKCH